jgi:LPXTG-motif cell wall-anchored protein
VQAVSALDSSGDVEAMMNRHMVGRRSPWIVTAFAVVVVGVASLATSGVAQAQALPLCGGNQTIRPAPWRCVNTKVIDGTEITVVLDVTAAGSATATFTLATARPVDTPIRIRWHEGISSGSPDEASGMIPAGSVGPVSLSVTTTTCGGQIDTKAVFTGNGDARGRVAAPFIGLDLCNQTTTTVTSTPAPITPTTGAESAPTSTPSTVLPAGVNNAPSSMSESTETLPSTGPRSVNGLFYAGLLALTIGVALRVLASRRLAR